MNIINGTEITKVQYASAGANVVAAGCSADKLLTTAGDAGSSIAGDFTKVSSYSVAKLNSNAAIVAISSQDKTLISANHDPDDAEFWARYRANRVYLLVTQLGSQYSAAPRTGTVVDPDAIINDCTTDLIKIRVDNDIWNDVNLTTVFVVDGDFGGRTFRIHSRRNESPYWYITPTDSLPAVASKNTCFKFIAYGTKAFVYPPKLTTLQPLPFITIDGLAVSSINPQVTSNYRSAPSGNRYVYVVSEANVNGVAQLFFYGISLDTGDIFSWKQLTYDGENKNAKIDVDIHGNLHIVWESSRCKQGQIYYGVLGPDSRGITNELFTSVINKQLGSDDSLLQISEAIFLDLRPLDQNGNIIGNVWSSFSAGGGSVDITDEATVTVEGNAATGKFAAFAALARDQDDAYFNDSFSQLSYQISFDLTVQSALTVRSRTVIKDLYQTFKDGFTPIGGLPNINMYVGNNSNRYTIGEPQYIFDNIIPIVGSYKAPGVYNNSAVEQLTLRHFMLAIVPEKVTILASNAETSAEYVARTGGSSGNYVAFRQQDYYTGQFKLALVTETSGNIATKDISEQKYHVAKILGDLHTINGSHNYKIAVHYSKLRKEHASFRAGHDSFHSPEQDFRFSGDIIVTVDDKAQFAQSFIADFSDFYNQFDIGIGCAIKGEYRPVNIKPYDGSTMANLAVTLEYTNIAIGPHTVIANPYLTNLAKTDRNVSKMFIASSTNAENSMISWSEVFGPNDTKAQAKYKVAFGLQRGKVDLSQIPITFEGRNTNPSICVDQCSRVSAAWQSNRDGNWEIYYSDSRNPAAPFRFDTRITEADGNSLMPSIAVDGSGHRMIVWHDSRNGVFEIYSARSNQNYECYNERCLSDEIINEYGYEDEYMYLSTGDDEYEHGGYGYEYGIPKLGTASIGSLSFKISNNQSNEYQAHFVANFYYDRELISLAKTVESRFNIGNWFVNGKPLAYDGYRISPGDIVEVSYNITEKDGLAGQMLFVEIELDAYDVTGSPVDVAQKVIDSTIVFYSPAPLLPVCSVPCYYVNDSGNNQNVHFRATFYQDSARTIAIMSASSSLDQRRWLSGPNAFPSGGITVDSNDTVSVVYNPEFLPFELSEKQDTTTVTSLICNTLYYVRVESLVSSSVVDTQEFVLECPCSVGTESTDKEWISSAQDSMDIRITDNDHTSLFPQIAGTSDDVFYIVWEDQRRANAGTISPSAYYAMWDAKTDTFYCQAQGYFDTLLSDRKFKPLVLIGDLLYPSFFYTNGKGVYRSTCSLYKAPIGISSSSSGGSSTYEPSLISVEDMDCLNIDVSPEYEISQYHETVTTPISLVDKCKIKLEITAPHGSYAVRLRNEDTEWGEWITAPSMVQTTSSSSSGGTFSPITDERFSVNWTLSAGNGMKTVTAQVMSYFGVTPEFSRNIIARYKELDYTVEFFLSDPSSGTGTQASIYQSYPVVSTNSIQVKEGTVSTISLNETPVGTKVIYAKVTFKDPNYLKELLTPVQDLTFDVILPGKTLRNNVLNPLAASTAAFDYSNPSEINLVNKRGSYLGSFAISKSDGLENKDGMATLVLNVPSPCLIPLEPDVCDSQRRTFDDVKASIAADITARNVSNEEFHLLYNKELQCSFIGSCVDEYRVDADDFYDDANFPPELSGTTECEEVDWSSKLLAEPCFFVTQGQNSNSWIVESQDFELDFSDTRIDYLRFNLDTQLDDILIMVKPGETVVPDISAICSTSSSSGSSRVVNFTVPSNSIIYRNNQGYYCHGPAECNFASARKIFKVGSTTICTIPEGTVANNKTNGSAVWSIPPAEGKNYNPLLSSSSSISNPSGCLITNFITSVSKVELKARGFLTNNDILRFKLIHIYSGTGYANIQNMTCGATCEE